MTQSNEGDAEIERQAARWVKRLRNEANASKELRGAFARWVLISPAHLGHFMAEYAFDEQLKSLRPLRQGTVEEWAAGLRESAERRRSVWSGRRWLLPVGLGMAVAIAAIVTLAVMFPAAWQISGPNAEWHKVVVDATRPGVFEDGSTVSTLTYALVESQFSQSFRRARQTAGDAYFKVKHDPLRPFSLDVPQGRIDITGTDFHVGIASEVTEVEVFEGKVLITSVSHPDPVELSAGFRTRITEKGVIEHPRRKFSSRPLSEIAEAFNQRKVRPRIVVQGTACQRLVSAILDMDDPAPLISDLKKDAGFLVQESAETVVIRERSDRNPGRGC
jgi:transmembrane sensor